MKTLLMTPPAIAEDGATARVMTQARALAAAGHEVHVVTPGPRAAVGGVRLHVASAGDSGRRRGVVGLWAVLLCAVAVVRVARRLRPDVVQVAGRGGVVLGALVSALLRRPVVCELSVCLSTLAEEHGFGSSSPLYRLAVRVDRWLLARQRLILAPSEASKRELVQRGLAPSERVHVVAAGVDTNELRPVERELARAKLLLKPNDPCIVCLSEADGAEAVEAVLSAVVMVQSKRPGTRLIIAGDVDSVRAQAEALGLHVAGSFEPHGDTTLARQWLSAADVVVGSSVSALQSSGALLVSLSCAAPTLAFDTAINRELMGGEGVFTKVDTAEVLAKLELLLARPALAQRWELRQRVETTYGLSTMTSALEEAYALATGVPVLSWPARGTGVKPPRVLQPTSSEASGLKTGVAGSHWVSAASAERLLSRVEGAGVAKRVSSTFPRSVDAVPVAPPVLLPQPANGPGSSAVGEVVVVAAASDAAALAVAGGAVAREPTAHAEVAWAPPAIAPLVSTPPIAAPAVSGLPRVTAAIPTPTATPRITPPVLTPSARPARSLSPTIARVSGLLALAVVLLCSMRAEASPLCDVGRTTGLAYALSDEPGAPTNAFFLECPADFDTHVGAYPLVVLIHGGSFSSGSPLDWFQGFTDSVTGQWRPGLARRLADAGFMVAAPAYRFAQPGVPYREGMDDIARFTDLIADYPGIQAAFKVDPARVTVVGTSAGGYLSMYEATRGHNSYRCAASVAGPLSLPISAGPGAKSIERLVVPLFGDGVNPPPTETLVELSPMARAYNLKKVGKVFLYHEQNDSAVSAMHSTGFAPFAAFVFGVPLSKFELYLGNKPASPTPSHLVDGDESGAQRMVDFLTRWCR